MAPDLRRKVDANRAARLAREAATRQQEETQVGRATFCAERVLIRMQLNDPDAQKPVWADASRR
jgi:hypothetical protein